MVFWYREKNRHWRQESGSVLSYKLRYIVGFGLVEMALELVYMRGSNWASADRIQGQSRRLWPCIHPTLGQRFKTSGIALHDQRVHGWLSLPVTVTKIYEHKTGGISSSPRSWHGFCRAWLCFDFCVKAATKARAVWRISRKQHRIKHKSNHVHRSPKKYTLNNIKNNIQYYYHAAPRVLLGLHGDSTEGFLQKAYTV